MYHNNGWNLSVSQFYQLQELYIECKHPIRLTIKTSLTYSKHKIEHQKVMRFQHPLSPSYETRSNMKKTLTFLDSPSIHMAYFQRFVNVVMEAYIIRRQPVKLSSL